MVDYQIRLKDTSGNLKAVFDANGGFRQLAYTEVVNNRGSFVVELDGDDDRISLFGLDSQVEIWRGNKALGIDWYKAFDGLYRTPVRMLPEDDDNIFRAHGFSLIDLLRRRDIRYHAGTTGAAKSGVGETVMKTFVSENLGSSATVVNGRIDSGVLTGFSVQTDGADGSNWSGSRSNKNLLAVLRDIADQTAVDFDVIKTGSTTFEFRTYEDQRGSDRTAYGLVRSTGLNGAGNVPVYFNTGNRTITNVVYSHNRSDEENNIAALGQGQKTLREIRIEQDATAVAASPLNKCEGSINANQEDSIAALENAAEIELQKTLPRAGFSFDVLQTEAQCFGRDYFLGDLVNVQFYDVNVDMKIISAAVVYGQEGERIAFDFQEVVR